MEINNKKTIAVVGMAGSGKSEAINYLQKKTSWPKIYFGQPTFDRIKKEGWELNNANEKKAREINRKELGMGAHAILSLPELKKLLLINNIVLIESLYSWEEYKILKKEYGESFFTIAIHASPKIRLQRLLGRKGNRPINSKEEFIERDWSEIEKTDKGGPIAIADFSIVNERGIAQLGIDLDSVIKNIIS